MRIRDFGINIGKLPTGRLNKISDVPGVKVGHCTIATETHNTGVTVVMPCEDDPFTNKLTCASFVLNGFGKTAGLVQIDELGTLETPIALTNTLNVGLVHDAMVEYMVRSSKTKIRSVNPIVCECNDASLSTITDRAVKAEHVFAAIESASEDFEEGAVGCGRGTTCHGLKGGVGSASRIITLDGKEYTVGVLMQTNHGSLADLTLDGNNIGKSIQKKLEESLPDKGSCIIILATDIPLSDRQLRRVIKRCSVGLARVGSFIGHGSGEVFIGFSTTNRISTKEKHDIIATQQLNEDKIDLVFRAAAECTEEAILNSMATAETVTGPKNTVRHAISEYL